MSKWLGIICAAFTAAWLSNVAADQKTLADCATQGHAVMAGGGVIRCEVVKEEGPT